MSSESDDPSCLSSPATEASAATTTATAADPVAAETKDAVVDSSLEAPVETKGETKSSVEYADVNLDLDEEDTGDAEFQTNLQAAQAGNTDAMIAVADAYWYGTAVAGNLKRAFMWYQRAADCGDMRGFYGLGWMYEHGEFVEKDLIRARENYEVADKGGHDGAKQRLYTLVLSLIRDGMEDETRLFTPELMETLYAAQCGDADAMIKLADEYWYGTTSVRNYEKAVHWYQQAAHNEHPDGYYGLGWCYEHGQGVPIDLRKALQCYERAMNLAHESAKGRYEELLARVPKEDASGACEGAQESPQMETREDTDEEGFEALF